MTKVVPCPPLSSTLGWSPGTHFTYKLRLRVAEPSCQSLKCPTARPLINAPPSWAFWMSAGSAVASQVVGTGLAATFPFDLRPSGAAC